jgi:hypothetical protein
MAKYQCSAPSWASISVQIVSRILHPQTADGVVLQKARLSLRNASRSRAMVGIKMSVSW